MSVELSFWWFTKARPWLKRHRWTLASIAVLVALWFGREIAAGAAALVAALLWGNRLRGKAAPAPSDSTRRLGEALRPRMEERAERELEQAAAELVESRAKLEAARKEREAIREMDPDELLTRSQEYAEKKRRERGGGVLAVLLLLAPSPAAAADPNHPDIIEALRPETSEPGYWVAPWLWRETLADASALPGCEASRASAERSVDHALRAADERAAQIIMYRAALAESDTALGAALRERDEAREERDAWYRSGWTVAAAGALGAMASAFAALRLVLR